MTAKLFGLHIFYIKYSVLYWNKAANCAMYHDTIVLYIPRPILSHLFTAIYLHLGIHVSWNLEWGTLYFNTTVNLYLIFLAFTNKLYSIYFIIIGLFLKWFLSELLILTGFEETRILMDRNMGLTYLYVILYFPDLAPVPYKYGHHTCVAAFNISPNGNVY